MKKTLSLCIAILAILFSFVSCKTSGPEDVSALVTKDGEPAGLVITYNKVIDKSSVSTKTYSIKGYEAGKVFASTVNPFLEEKPEGKVSYVVILLKAGDNPAESVSSDTDVIAINTTPNISVQQVKSIKTVDGKVVPAWKESFKATNAFPINGGLMTK